MSKKDTGMLRKLDELGRIVIPIEIRNKFNLKEKDPIEIYVDNDAIILKKHEDKCLFCGKTKKLIEYKNKYICEECSENINKLNKN